MLRVEAFAPKVLHVGKPIPLVSVILMGGVVDDFQEFLISPRASTVVRRTRSCPVYATRIDHPVFSGMNVFQFDKMLPSISKIVFVNRRRVLSLEEVCGDLELPIHLHSGIIFVPNTEPLLPARLGALDVEFVKMTVPPAKGIRKGDVEIPEGVGPGDFNQPPDRRLHQFQGDFEPIDLAEGMGEVERSAGVSVDRRDHDVSLPMIKPDQVYDAFTITLQRSMVTTEANLDDRKSQG